MTDPAQADLPALRIALPPVLRSRAVARLFRVLPDARIVGGAVRDAIAGRYIADVDLATPHPPRDATRKLRKAGIRVIPTGIAHGTVTALLHSHTFEITTLRQDLATDGRHAEVGFTADWRQDAARRDFTINAMSMTLDGDVFDYFGGVADLQAGIVRFVGDPAQRIAEDYLRVLRFFRFYARYAATPPDPALRTALHAAIPGLGQLSAERVWAELRQILSAPRPEESVALMAELGILDAIIPEGADPTHLARLVAAHGPVDPLLRVAALLTGDIEAFAARLRLSRAQRKHLLALRTTPLARPDDDDDALRRMLADHDRAALIDRTWLAHVVDGEPRAHRWKRLRTRLETLPQPVFPFVGRDVLALGLPSGPHVGALLRATRAWWLAGGCVADTPACRAELLRLAARIIPDSSHQAENPPSEAQSLP